jgi:hypothetical protein
VTSCCAARTDKGVTAVEDEGTSRYFAGLGSKFTVWNIIGQPDIKDLN